MMDDILSIFQILDLDFELLRQQLRSGKHCICLASKQKTKILARSATVGSLHNLELQATLCSWGSVEKMSSLYCKPICFLRETKTLLCFKGIVKHCSTPASNADPGSSKLDETEDELWKNVKLLFEDTGSNRQGVMCSVFSFTSGKLLSRQSEVFLAFSHFKSSCCTFRVISGPNWSTEPPYW